MVRTDAEDCEALFEREVAELWNGDGVDVVDELYAPEFVASPTPDDDWPAVSTDRSSLKAAHREWNDAFAALETEVDGLVVDGHTVHAQWRRTGRHEGTFRGIAPTGNDIAVSGYSYRRERGGQFVEATDQTEMPTLLSQLGVEADLEH
ncbi:ester cyclase [Salinirubellus salinus]|jgi:hypothetical protein|uniref:Ester cyclase n=1 Tax=Salinirubellus salinus TaxID=1364945 RepID=A0A9E7R4U0_9EURY|nr:ester cyclase [Salinirubellus salinus]UWM55814.1 ester cyclase [Salinirubellus salinus]